MTEWYLDISTEGADPQRDRILTIQYQAIANGEVTGPFQILAEWEWGEKQIVRSIVEKGLLDPASEFVPVGGRLTFAITFIIAKAEKYEIKKFAVDELRNFWINKPLVDLASLVALEERRKSKRLSTSDLPGESGAMISTLYSQGRYADILESVTRDKDEVVRLLGAVESRLEARRVAQERPTGSR